LPVITLEPDLERLLANSLAAMRRTGAGTRLAEPLQHRVAEAARRQEGSGEPRLCWFRRRCGQNLTRFLRSSLRTARARWNGIPDNRKVRLVTAVESKFDDKRGVLEKDHSTYRS